MWWQQAIISATVALIAGGGLVGILTLRGQRAKLEADADSGLATAAETLTGSALALVRHAESRAAQAEDRAAQAQIDAAEAHRMALLAQQRLSRLLLWIRTQGMEPPPWVEGEGTL